MRVICLVLRFEVDSLFCRFEVFLVNVIGFSIMFLGVVMVIFFFKVYLFS